MEETRIFPRPFTNGPKDALFTEIILFLRFVQQCSLVVTLFIATYFVYWHITLVDDVPKGLFVLIGASAITLVLLQISTLSHILFPRESVINPLKNAIAQSFILGIGYTSLFSVDGLDLSKADDWFKPIRESKGFGSLRDADVEAHHATLATCLVWLGGIAVASTATLTALAIWKAFKTGRLTFSLPRRARRLGEYAPVGRRSEDFDDDETVFGDGSIKTN